MLIPLEVSARHVHLSEVDLFKLFGEKYVLSKKRDLSQPGQYLCEERVKLIGPKGCFESVAVLGPVRSKTQVEISITDSRKLGIKPVIRESGDTEGTPGCVLCGPKGEIEINSGVIVSKRHIHMNEDEAKKLNLKNGEFCSVEVNSDGRSIIFKDVIARVSKNFSLSMHIDTDESNAVNWNSEVKGNIIYVKN